MTLVFTYSAGSDIAIDLIPETAGPYACGELVRVDVYLRQTTIGPDRLMRLLQLDFEMTSPALDLSQNPDSDVDGSGPNGICPDFQFALASFPQGGAFYSVFPELPRPALGFSGTVANTTRQLILHGDGTPLYLGFVNVRATQPGEYALDAATPGDPNDPSHYGALVSWGFGVLPGDDIVEARPGDGLTGGQYFFGSSPQRVLFSSDPPDGTIDARQETPSSAGVTRQGIDRVTLRFTRPVVDDITLADIEPETITIDDSTGDPPVVLSVTPLDGTKMNYEIVLEEPISVRAWTTMTAHVIRDQPNSFDCGSPGLPPPPSVAIGFLPGDVDGSGRVTVQDITALINSLNRVPNRVLPRTSTDINRSGASNAHDITRLIDLMNGANATQPWFNATLPPES
ncbi:MAG: hypothetical protein HY763_13400 [Planctomycetes bacterium]|nr:hypothetical protein [Planctomycetota bacterium]